MDNRTADNTFKEYFKYSIIKEMLEIGGVSFDESNKFGVTDLDYNEFLNVTTQTIEYRFCLHKDHDILVKAKNVNLFLAMKDVCERYAKVVESGIIPSLSEVNNSVE